MNPKAVVLLQSPGRVFRERHQDNRVGMSRVAVADLVEQVCWFTWDVLCTRECAHQYIDNETYKEVAIVEKSVVKQCVSCVGSVFEFASATICALIVSQLELECTESEGSRKSGSAILMDAQNPVYDEAGA